MGWEGSSTKKERFWKAQPNPLNIQKAFTGAIIRTNIPTSPKRHGWKLLLIVAPKISVQKPQKPFFSNKKPQKPHRLRLKKNKKKPHKLCRTTCDIYNSTAALAPVTRIHHFITRWART